MKIAAEHVKEMHEAKYSRDTAVIAQTRDEKIVVAPETTARERGWRVLTDAIHFEDWTGGYPIENADCQEFANSINADLELM